MSVCLSVCLFHVDCFSCSSLSDSFDRLHVDVIDKELRATMTRLQREYVRQDQLQTYLDALNEDKADIGKVQTLEQKVDRLAIQLTSISSQIQGWYIINFMSMYHYQQSPQFLTG